LFKEENDTVVPYCKCSGFQQARTSLPRIELVSNTITVYERRALRSWDFWNGLESFGTDSNANLSVFFSVDIPLCVMAAAADIY